MTQGNSRELPHKIQQVVLEEHKQPTTVSINHQEEYCRQWDHLKDDQSRSKLQYVSAKQILLSQLDDWHQKYWVMGLWKS